MDGFDTRLISRSISCGELSHRHPSMSSASLRRLCTYQVASQSVCAGICQVYVQISSCITISWVYVHLSSCITISDCDATWYVHIYWYVHISSCITITSKATRLFLMELKEKLINQIAEKLCTCEDSRSAFVNIQEHTVELAFRKGLYNCFVEFERFFACFV